ncbi:MAG: NTP transferase domain-containing protein [Candidatus Zixiibacteriota bacterium]
MTITGVVLAAGKSERMGCNKLLMPFGQQTVFETTLQNVISSRVDRIIVVSGYEHERIERLAKRWSSERVQTVFNPDYSRGRAESIKLAVRFAGVQSEAMLFMVADKPTVTTDLIDRAIERFVRDRPALLYVNTPSGRGHPIIFGEALFAELASLSGDSVGNDLVTRYRANSIELWDDTEQIDIDTPADYRMAIGQCV